MASIDSLRWKKQSQFHVIGVMSGTSLDGVDLVSVTFQKRNKWHFKIHCTQTQPFSKNWHRTLGSLTGLTASELTQIDKEFTQLLGGMIVEFIETNRLTAIDAICSHGHTALHQPDQGITYQIGNRSELATLIGCPVVCDFRKQDVVLGGQGAPLVPVGDRLLFSEYDACLNLGGFANVTRNRDSSFIAFDVGGFNLVFNRLARLLSVPYDDQGCVARSGNVIPSLFTNLEQLPYYDLEEPKSLGLEWLEKEVFPMIDSALATGEAVADVMHTYAHHIASQLSRSLMGSTKILCTGGGAFNRYTLQLVEDKVKQRLYLPSEEIINFKESVVFGFLGILRLLEQPNCFSSITGAKHDHSSGVLHFPQNTRIYF